MQDNLQRTNDILAIAFLIWRSSISNEKRWNSAYRRQGTSYKCRDVKPAIWRISMNEWLDAAADLCPLTTFRICQ